MIKSIGKKVLTVLTAMCLVFCIAASGIVTAAGAPEKGKYVTTDILRLRSVPTTKNNTALLSIPKDIEITITAVTKGTDGRYWGKTSYNKVSGYVCMDYCLAVDPAEPQSTSGDNSIGLYKTKVNLNMRRSPTTSSERVCIVPAGKILNVISVSKDNSGYCWGKALYNSNSGTFTNYIRLDNCEKYTLPEYSSPGKATSVHQTVIDISQWQTEDDLDWVKLKANGVDGVIIRIGGRYYGSSRTIYTDETFYTHYINARAAGLNVGCYFFSYALNAAGAKEEAQAVLSELKKYNCELNMPVFADIEEGDGRHDHYYAGTKACTTVADTFCKTIEDGGSYAGIYCSLDFAKNLISPTAAEGRGMWVAQYNNVCTFTGRYDMWQYTRTGRISGFNGNLDINICYVNYPLIVAAFRSAEETTVPENSTAPDETTAPAEPITNPDVTTTAPQEDTTSGGGNDYSGWLTDTPATCLKDGKKIQYRNGKAVCESIITKKHDNTVECVLGNTKMTVSAGDIIDNGIFESSFYVEGSPYFLQKLNETKQNGGCYCVYCKDCGEILEIKNYYKSNNCVHSYAEKTLQKATCAEEGKQQEYCIHCSRVFTETIIEKAEHKAGGAVLSWQTDEPYSTVTCSDCGAILEKKYIPAGDVGADGTVEITDARAILRVAIGLDKTKPHYIKLGDLNGDNALTINDARLILRKAIGLDK